MKRALQFIPYAAFRVVSGAICLFPIEGVFRIGAIAGGIFGICSPRYRRLVAKNLGIAFGDKPPVTPGEVLSRLGANLFAGVKVSRMTASEVAERVEMVGREHIGEGGGGAIITACHLSCWELLALLPSMTPPGAPQATLFQPLGNYYMNRYIRSLRESQGMEAIDRSGGFRRPVEVLRGGGFLGILIDQHAGDKGVWCPFFGRLASTSHLTGIIAQRAGVPVVPVAVATVGVARWRMEFGKPMATPAASEMAAFAADLNMRAQEAITAAPADWFWVHRRWKTPQPNFLLRHYKRGVTLPTDSQMSVTDLQPFRTLVRSPNWLGDACMAIPAVRAIKRGRPDNHLTVLVPGKFAALWEAVVEVDQVIAIPAKASVFAVAKLLKNAGPFDAGVILPNSTRSALEMKLGAVPERFGFAGSLRSKLLTKIAKDRKQPGPVEHHAYHYLRLARELGADVKDPDLLAPLVETPQCASGVHIGICPGAEYGAAKRYPAERFGEAAAKIAEAHPKATFAIFGIAGDAPAAEAVFASLPDERCKNLAGKTTLPELIAELRKCTLLLTNDTGTMHLAAAFGVRTAAIFGSTEPAWTRALGAGHTIIRHHVECSPCFLRECPGFGLRCMNELPATQVADAVLATLADRAR